MKKKILVIALSCLMLISAMGVVSAFAANNESTPELTVYKHNLSFSETIYIMYAVEARNAKQSDVELLLWTSPQSEYTADNAETKLSSAGTTTVDGKNCLVFEYRELAARQMTDYVYARAHVSQDGEDYYSEVSKYSILTYAYSKLGKIDPASETTNAKLKTLLTNMLTYGASAQEYFGYKTDTLASDNFSYITVNGGTLSDGFTTGLYKTGTAVTLTAPETSGDLVFDCWTNSNDEMVSDSAIFELTVPEENETYTATYVKPYSKGLELTLSNDSKSYSVTGIGNCTDWSVVIPERYKGKPVTSIGDSAFAYYESDLSVTIPDSVTSIGKEAFYGCRALTKVKFGENSQLTSIGAGAFSDCTFLKEIDIPDSVTSIGDAAFGHCSMLSSVNMPNGISSISNYAFSGCTNLSSITIPDSVTTIGDWAFNDCSGLTSVTIGNAVTSIGDYAFYYCKGLTSITIPDSVTGIGSGAFNYCMELKSVTIGNSVTSIDGRAFSWCTGLTDIYFNGTKSEWEAIEKGSNWDSYTGNYTVHYNNNYSSGLKFALNDDGKSYSVTGIGTCKDLDVVIPDTFEGKSVTSIGEFAFSLCAELTSITIPDSVTSIGAQAFNYCTELTSITIPDSVTNIGNAAFSSCEGLTSITISNSVTSIGAWAFSWCRKLTSIDIPNSVTSIGEGVFYGCSELGSITVDSDNTVYHSAGNCIIETESKTLIAGCINSVIPADGSVESIGSSAFYGCSGLWWSIDIPDSVTSIGSSAFYGCTGLTSITIPNSVTSIGNNAFNGCTELKNVTFNGSKKQWSAVSIGTNNECLTSATMKFTKMSGSGTSDDPYVIEAGAPLYAAEITTPNKGVCYMYTATQAGTLGILPYNRNTQIFVSASNGEQFISYGDICYLNVDVGTEVEIVIFIENGGTGSVSFDMFYA